MSPAPVSLDKTPAGMKFCHRFQMPATWMEQGAIAGVQGAQTIVKQQMGFVPCIADKCMRWNTEHKQCNDNVETAAHASVALYLSQLVKLKDDEVVGSEA